MAKTMKRKRPTKRVRLAAALRKEMEPLMRAHGFDHPPKSLDRWIRDFPRADHWERWVGDDRQVIRSQWDKWNGPKFRLHWSDDAINRERGYWIQFGLEPWRLRPLSPLFHDGWFGGLSPIGAAVSLAMQRVNELLHYWETGERCRHLGFDYPHKQFRWPEEYDRETGMMKPFEPEP